MRRIGYGRQSRADPLPDTQREALQLAGVDEIYVDAFDVTVTHRPEFDRVRAALRPGDALVITSLDRLARSARDLADIITDLGDHGIDVEIVEQQITTRSSEGRLLYQMVQAFADFERAVMISRSKDGLASLKTAAKGGDPRRRLSEEDVTEVRRLYVERLMSVRDLAVRYGVSRPTIYRALDVSRDRGHHPRRLSDLGPRRRT